MKKFLSLVIALAIMVSMFVVPSMAFGGDYFAAYSGVTHNGPSEYVFWFDADAADYNWDDGENNDAADISDGGAFRGFPYVSIIRNFSTPKGVNGEDSFPLWGVEDGNRYLNMNSKSRWTNDNCINNAYTLTMDVRLNGANVATKFAGIRMYTTNDIDPYAATFASGLSFNISAADATKDQLIISVANTDAELAIDLANDTFASWTTLKIVDDFAGNMVVCLEDEIVAELTLAGSSVEIAAGDETVSTTDANIYSKANFHVANLNDGDLHLDNIGVKAYDEADIPEAPATEAPATEEPATEAPATEEPATEAPATEEPATEAPATEEPATEAPATEEPATEAPATEEPATEEPATEAPATEEPATEAPATEEPATEAPATEEPATEAPATEEPATEAPATEEPATEAPATEEPATEAPATEEPATEAPATEEPATEAPATEAPATEEPATEAPATEEPATEAPATEAPATEAPATEEPATEAPATEAPATEEPATEAPATEAPATEAPATEAPATDAPTAEMGDVDTNGVINAKDVSTLRRVVATGFDISNFNSDYADLNGDGLITSLDVTLLRRLISSGWENKDAVEVKTQEDLNEAISNSNAGDTIVLNSGSYELGDEVSDGLTIVGNGETVITDKPAIKAEDVTVENVIFKNENDTSAVISGSGEFKNCIFEGQNGLYHSEVSDKIIFDGCTFKGDVYSAHFEGSGDIIFKNCVFSGWTSFASNVNVYMEDCIFDEHDVPEYNTLRFWADAELVNCTFNPVMNIEATEGVQVILDGCSVTDTEITIKDLVRFYDDVNGVSYVIDGEVVTE